ncbi:hypothetical protein HB818_14050 [Listeria booriae]|uniref:hypothetical protein n=1 Tax=Listeria booriae TaxID=1552123 RepID=UPI0016270113|nr:hypothetical protein [Listeria booriae]MBC1286883.1 hypothetical protein [Listeria booriae]
MTIKMGTKISASLNKKLNAAIFEKAVATTVERQALASSSKTARYAPRKTGALANSFPANVHKIDETHWAYGSDLDYAEIQEFTNRTKKGFVRKTIQEDTPAFKINMQQALKKAAK